MTSIQLGDQSPGEEGPHTLGEIFSFVGVIIRCVLSLGSPVANESLALAVRIVFAASTTMHTLAHTFAPCAREGRRYETASLPSTVLCPSRQTYICAAPGGHT